MERIFMNKKLKNLKEVIFHNKILKHTQVSTLLECNTQHRAAEEVKKLAWN